MLCRSVNTYCDRPTQNVETPGAASKDAAYIKSHSRLRTAVVLFLVSSRQFRVYRNAGPGPVRRGPQILDRPWDCLTELTGRAQRPVRITQELARDEDRICAAGRDDLLGLSGRRDHPDRAGHYVCLSPESPGERRLVPGTDRNAGAGRVATRRAVDEVDAELLQDPGERNRLLDIPAA